MRLQLASRSLPNSPLYFHNGIGNKWFEDVFETVVLRFFLIAKKNLGIAQNLGK
ncbi:hypothetical protein LDG_5796 [Legionella drancourtii LLAP12]|uniref:Uncharacterized protein n=1 Tax=Legionella drancourtii LLAP12 TaxID=658187 RepID=G9EKQ7_9GAMM|nr:hypothetical protein LDG_5796 [Legionella drancourtii LLAP12]